MSGHATTKNEPTIDVDLIASAPRAHTRTVLGDALVEALRARDAYRKLVDELQLENEKLKKGLFGPKTERHKDDPNAQLSFQLLCELLGAQAAQQGLQAQEVADSIAEQVDAESLADAQALGEEDNEAEREVHRAKRKRTGRAAARKDLPEVQLEVIPDEVKRLGLEAFERIGEERSTHYERRTSSLVKVTVIRPKFVAKTGEASQAVKQARADRGALPEQDPLHWVAVAEPPELPIPRGLAGPLLLANTVVRRFADSLPYHRLEGIYEREGMRLGRSTICGWHDELRQLCAPLIEAMKQDALKQPYLCIDATGVLVQAPERCSRGHFWVLIAPGRHVLYAFSQKHDSAAVDTLLLGYEGYVVADAHSVYDHLFGEDGADEVGCWGHCRRYFIKTLGSEPDIAKEALQNLRILFALERKFASKPRKQRERMRRTKGKVLVDRHFELCRRYADYALDATPLRAAITYSTNQEAALRRFLGDARLPATNNISERELRRQAVGRKNWLFVASQDGAEVNATFTSFIASCQMFDIEPEAYLRDLFCLLPDWPLSRVLELAPCNWKQTREQLDTQQRLAKNLFRNAILQLDAVHSTAT